MAEPVTVKLRNPIQVGTGEPIVELVVRPLTGKDMRKLPQGSEVDISLALAGRLSGQPDHVIDRLEGDDLIEVLEVVGGFTQRSPKTGNAPSET